MKKLTSFLSATILAVTLAGCATNATVQQSEIDALELEIRGLGPEVDPGEAKRAAHIAYNYTAQLRQSYDVTDPPLVHNVKVNSGIKERGLCNHWAEDIEKRLKAENFQTLTIHRAISPRTAYRIIHHTAVVSRRGDTMYDGIVLDGWRNGGDLFWEQTRTDTRYNWRPREEVVAEMIRDRSE